MFRFGPFQLDPLRHELLKHGRRMRMSASMMRLLGMFVSRSGVLVTRDEIAGCLWTDPQNIDISNGINTAINRLRYELTDDPASPIYIETVIGLGYRFIAPVENLSYAVESPATGPASDSPDEELAREQQEKTEASADGPPPIEAANRRYLRWTIPVTLAVLALVTVVGTVIALRQRSHAAPPVVGALFPQPLSEVTFNDGDDKVLASALSPDGGSIAFSDHSGVSVHLLGVHSERRILTPPDFSVDHIVWDTPNSQIWVSGVAETTRQRMAWALSLIGEPPRLLLEDASHLALSFGPDRVAFTRKDDTEIWVADANGQNPRRLLSGGPGETFPFLLWAPGGDRLLFERYSIGRLSRTGSPVEGSGTPAETLEQLDRWTCESIDSHSGKILDVEENIQLDSAYELPDGRLYYPANESYAELKRARLMTVKTDPATGRFLGAPTLAANFDAGVAGSISASADGKKIAAVLERRTADVFEASFNPVGPALGEPNRVTHHGGNNYPHAWTPSGDAILFESGRSSPDAIYEQKLTPAAEDRFGGEILARLPEQSAMAEFTPDGKWILFMEFSGRPQHADAIYRVPANGGAPTQVVTKGAIDEFHCSISGSGICVLRETLNKNQFVFYSLDPVTGMGAELARTPWTANLLGDWSISPDGSAVASADHDPQHPGIRFISLTSPDAGSVTETTVDGFGTLLGATWSADGKTLFVQSRTDTGYQLLLADRQGHAKLLRESPIPIWAVPSRDGKKLAFPGPTINTNVWIGDAIPW
ncbi:MAG: winged helix-turn-helix domain-containing protein [Terracidiphilus sp.]